ncbi:MAG TPA: carbamoyltransferase C-terminal domain-containing protein [Actinomycetaceae bacterium]|nr:carbamoyltransferase C-terminal domain-containing protein [Actinomycetaceae bacterium]
MIILGINHYFHDSTACLLVDGKIAVAIEEERLNRRKHTREFPERAIRLCLSEAGLTPADVDAVAVSIKPDKNLPQRLAYGIRNAPNAVSFFTFEFGHWALKQTDFRRWYRKTWPSGGPKVHFVPHHMAHAVGSFLASPFDDAAILSIDGAGEWSTSFLGEGRGTRVRMFSESFFPDSLGSFYEVPTQYCGFIPNTDEGKTMGLASFGDPDRFGDIVDRLVTVDEEGRIHIDLEMFNYQFWGPDRFNDRFVETFGPARAGFHAPIEKHHEDVAAAFQQTLEERALEMCAHLRRQSRSRYLVISGGVALNSVMNGRILREAGFDDIYVMPAAGDNGTALGAALYVDSTVMGNPRRHVHDDPYLGTAYTDDYIEKLITTSKLTASKHEDIAGTVAQLLADGKIVGWFQGRMEIGPRALGNRSILADPTLPHMKDKINAEVKHRESFRPFAPSVIAEATGTYFDITTESPFMLRVCDVLPDMRERLPAITHVDGTARLHTVKKDVNPLYHDVISRFGQLSGVPVVLNTSFNVQGEPIVESPEQALRCFATTGLDAVAMGSWLVEKGSAF